MAKDKDGHPLSAYPDPFRSARLVGITNEGLAAYHEGSRVFLAELEEGSVKTPPEGYGPAHELELDAFEWDLADYIIETASDEGVWRALSEYAVSELIRSNRNQDDIVR